jgi:hypothetical protein
VSRNTVSAAYDLLTAEGFLIEDDYDIAADLEKRQLRCLGARG